MSSKSLERQEGACRRLMYGRRPQLELLYIAPGACQVGYYLIVKVITARNLELYRSELGEAE
jgi:hypothetical protein